jgi:hypothetical protein
MRVFKSAIENMKRYKVEKEQYFNQWIFVPEFWNPIHQEIIATAC